MSKVTVVVVAACIAYLALNGLAMVIFSYVFEAACRG